MREVNLKNGYKLQKKKNYFMKTSPSVPVVTPVSKSKGSSDSALGYFCCCC